MADVVNSSLPNLPDGWCYEALEDLLVPAGISYGIVQPGMATPSGIPIIRVKDLKNGRVNQESPLRVAPEIEEKYSRTRLRGGEVLLSLVGSVGEVAIATKDLVGWNVARAIGVLRPSSRVSPEWLKLCLSTDISQAHMHARLNTTVQATLNLRDVRTTPVLMPPQGQRDAIVEVVGALDVKIAVNERIASTAEELALVLASGENWLKRLPLGEISTLMKEQIDPQALPGEPVDHFSLPAFDAGKSAERVRPEAIKSNKFLVTAPSVLLSKLNPDIPRVWNMEPIPGISALASTEFLVLAPHAGISPHELWAVTAQREFLDVLASKVTGTSKSHQRVRPAEVLATEVVDPRQFGETGKRIQSLALTGAAARTESRILAALRDTLLPQLMSGRLRVRDAEKIVEDAV